MTETSPEYGTPAPPKGDLTEDELKRLEGAYDPSSDRSLVDRLIDEVRRRRAGR